jgi:hypothetical protein
MDDDWMTSKEPYVVTSLIGEWICRPERTREDQRDERNKLIRKILVVDVMYANGMEQNEKHNGKYRGLNTTRQIKAQSTLPRCCGGGLGHDCRATGSRRNQLVPSIPCGCCQQHGEKSMDDHGGRCWPRKLQTRGDDVVKEPRNMRPC